MYGNTYLRFKVFTLWRVKIVVLLVLISHSIMYGYKHFGVGHRLQEYAVLQPSRPQSENRFGSYSDTV